MYSSVNSSAMVGVEPRPVTVEASIIPHARSSFTIVGLPDAVVRESRERVRAAMKRQGWTFPGGRVVVALSPAEIPKGGSTFDLPIACSIVGAILDGAIDFDPFVIVGELALDGTVKPVPSVLGAIEVARAQQRTCLASSDSLAREGRAELIAGVRYLREAVAIAQGTATPHTVAPSFVSPSVGEDLSVVRGQVRARRALEIAAAGGHHLLLNGAPGSGKTLLARCLPGILPPLTEHAQNETALIQSALGLDAVPSTDPPFRDPHHTSSTAALVGGGIGIPRPGEVTRAHRGVLFLDELGEFSPATLDALRQPVEEGFVSVARSTESITFPADIQLVGATNPCPCGYDGDRHRPCRCTEAQKDRYRHRLSGPLMDRFDLKVTVDRLRAVELAGDPGESSADVRRRVVAARTIQNHRGGLNRNLTRTELDRMDMESAAVTALTEAYDTDLLTGRGWDRVRRCARTIADLDAAEVINRDHVVEAIEMRTGVR